MTDLLTQINPKIHSAVETLYRAGARHIALKGGRRSGKSFYLMQRALTASAMYGRLTNVATMTAEQGRLGMYADAEEIIASCPTKQYFRILTAPREIRCIYNKGKVFFSVYPNPERAKGVACDISVINEANNFSLKQVQDITASVRDVCFYDYNQSPDWVEKVIPAECVVQVNWWDNPYLTEPQKQYFYDLKRNASSANANAMDEWLYRVYYLGEDAELQAGEIFTPANIRKIKQLPEGLGVPIVFCDPSSMRGADYFAMVLGMTDGKSIYIIDSFSENIGNPEINAFRKLVEWNEHYDAELILIETNGYGKQFFEYCYKSELPVTGWSVNENKFQRIADNYQSITERVFFLETEQNEQYLQQVYEFGKNCLHDDNIDAVNSLWRAYHYYGYV